MCTCYDIKFVFSKVCACTLLSFNVVGCKDGQTGPKYFRTQQMRTQNFEYIEFEYEIRMFAYVGVFNT